MYPMSLYESEESNGSVSLSELFDHPEKFDGCISELSIDGLIFAICRGGWPHSLSNKTDRAKLEVAKDLYRQTYSVDISNIDNTKRNPRWAQEILRSYSRNLCTLAESNTIFAKSHRPVHRRCRYGFISAIFQYRFQDAGFPV